MGLTLLDKDSLIVLVYTNAMNYEIMSIENYFNLFQKIS